MGPLLLIGLTLAGGCAGPPSAGADAAHRSTLPLMGISYRWPTGFGTESRRGMRGRHRAHLRPEDPSLILGVLQFENDTMTAEERVETFVVDIAEGGRAGPLERRDINGLDFLLQRSTSSKGWVEVGLTRRNGLSLLAYSIVTRTGSPRRDAENAHLAAGFFGGFEPVSRE